MEGLTGSGAAAPGVMARSAPGGAGVARRARTRSITAWVSEESPTSRLTRDPTGKVLVEGRGPGVVAHPVEHRQTAAKRALVVPAEQDGPAHQTPGVALPRRALRRHPGRLRCEAPQADPLAGDPVFEVRGGIGDEHAVQEVASIPHQGRLGLPRIQRRLERTGIGAECTPIKADLLLPAIDDRALADGLSQKVKGLPERAPGVILIEFGPEEGEQGIAPTKPARWGRAER